MVQASRLFALGGVAVSSNRTILRPSSSSERAQAREVIWRFVDLLFKRRQVRAAFESCVAATGFCDSDLEGTSGRHAAIELISRRLGDPGLRIQVLDVLIDGPQGIVRLVVNENGNEHQRIDIFRVDRGRIVEHRSFVERRLVAVKPAIA